MKKLNCSDIEISLAHYFGTRKNYIVPNVSYGLGIHEVDLLIVSLSGYCTEIEIKTSVSDLKADLKKEHGHESNKIKYFYFAVPEKLKEKALELIPERAGLFIIKDSETLWHNCEIIKEPITNKNALALTAEEYAKLGHLSAMRIWNLKEIIRSLVNENRSLRDNPGNNKTETLSSDCP
jgi:hypothetical protein